MSLRFLTRRRDRDRSNSIFHSKRATQCVVLPDELARSPNPPLPADVHVISWHPRHLEAAGREVHIRSRLPDPSHDPAQFDTPVYRAFTAATTPTIPSHPSAHPITHTLANRSDIDLSRSHRASSSRAQPPPTAKSFARPKTASSVQDRIHPASASRPSLLSADHARLDPVEMLQSSTTPTLAIESDPHASKLSLGRRIASKVRRVKSRSHHAGLAYDSGFETDEDVYATLPSTAATSASRFPYTHTHRNASVQSFASFTSTTAHDSLLSPSSGTAPASSATTSLLSRLPTARKLRQRQNASTADISASDSPAPAAPALTESPATSRSRSASVGNTTAKLLRSKESSTLIAPNPPATPTKPRLARGAPPSAWRPDAAGPDAAAGVSSSYSSDNDASAGSSSGHAHTLSQPRPGKPSVDATAAAMDHAELASRPDAQPGNVQLQTPSAHASDSSVKRFSALAARSPALLSSTLDPGSSPCRPGSRPGSRRPGSASPIASGLPLPSPILLTASPAAHTSLLASQLFTRLGPPPVGLEPHRFDERVLMIQDYIEGQVPPLPGVTMPDRVTIGAAGSRASLPPPARAADARTAALEDEFDKLECQTERAMLELAVHKGDGVRVEIAELRLADAFLAARRRCGVDSSRSHFELSAHPAAHSGSPELMHDARFADGAPLIGALGALRPAAAVRPQVGHEAADGLGGLGVSLRPAPRRRRRPITAPEAPNKGAGMLAASVVGVPGADPRESVRAQGAGRLERPATARAVDSTAEAVASELFTPASFSSRPTTATAVATGVGVGEVDEVRQRQTGVRLMSKAGLRRGSSDRDSASSHTTATTHRSVRSPLFFAPALHASSWSMACVGGAGERQRTHSQETADTEHTEHTQHTDASDSLHTTIKRFSDAQP